MKIKTRYARRKKISNYLFFGIALLMLSLFFFRSTAWSLTAVFISIGLLGLSVTINRCPSCKARIKNDEYTTCESCGCELK